VQITVVILVAVMYAWPVANIGTFHLRIVEAMNTDEGEFLWPIIECMNRGDFNIGRNDYGLFYYNIVLVSAKLLKTVFHINDTILILIARWWSFIFLVSSAWFTGNIAEQLKKGTGLLTFLLVFIGSNTLLKYSLMLHPDTAQVFFVVVSVWGMFKYLSTSQFGWLLMSGMLAGLAFSSKFVGVLLLPILVLLIIKHVIRSTSSVRNIHSISLLLLSLLTIVAFDSNWVNSYLTETGSSRDQVLNLINWIRLISIIPLVLSLAFILVAKWRNKRLLNFQVKAWLWMLILGWVFLTAFAITSPQLIKNFSFLDGFIYVTSMHSEGHWFYDNSGLLGWLNLLFSIDVVPWWFWTLSLVGIIWSLLDSKKQPWYHIILVSWMIVFMLTIGLGVSSKFAHYLIPVIPFVLLYAVQGFSLILKKAFKNEWESRVHITVILVVLLIGIPKLYGDAYQKVEAYEQSDELAAGKWLQNYTSAETMLLCDKYVYVPALAHLKHVSVWGLMPEHITEFNPDFVITHSRIYEHYLDQSRAKDYIEGEELYLTRNELYQSFLNGEYMGYELVKDFNTIKVYGKKKALQNETPS
jgi:4-amino-4-deoxy-L-arabinose transferase-like glycosyltransferase